MAKMFIRENVICCGADVKEVSLVPCTGNMLHRGRRAKKEKLSAPKQQRLNDWNSRKYFIQLLNTNFGDGDYHISCTYNDDMLPSSVEEGEKNINNFLRRLKARYERAGKELKYMLTTSFRTGKTDGKPVRMHHHIVVNGDIPAIDIIRAWATKVDGKMRWFGYCNVDPLQTFGDGLTALAVYLAKQPRESLARRWKASQNLKKPIRLAPDDYRHAPETVEQLAAERFDEDTVRYFEKKYPGWTVGKPYKYNYYATDANYMGWSIYVRLVRRRDRQKNKPR